MYETSWMKFEQSGRVEDYLVYCAKNHKEKKESEGCTQKQKGDHPLETSGKFVAETRYRT